jgi:hypothetical protein
MQFVLNRDYTFKVIESVYPFVKSEIVFKTAPDPDFPGMELRKLEEVV